MKIPGLAVAEWLQLDLFGLIRLFEKHLKSDDPDLDVLDEIVDHKAWKENRHAAGRQTRTLEKELLNYFESKIDRLLHEAPVDYGKISEIVRRPCWQTLRLEKKRCLEDAVIHKMIAECRELLADAPCDLPFEKIFPIMDEDAWKLISSMIKSNFEQEIIRELEGLFKADPRPTVAHHVDLMYRISKDETILPRLKQKTDDYRNRQGEFKEYVRETIHAIEQAIDRGALETAAILLEELQARAPECAELGRCRSYFDIKYKECRRQIDRFQAAITSGDLEKARQELRRFKDSHGESEAFFDLEATFKGALCEYLSYEAGRLYDEKGFVSACKWLQRHVDHYPEHLDIRELMRSYASIHGMFQEYVEGQDGLVLDALEAWSMDRIQETIQHAGECCACYGFQSGVDLGAVSDLVCRFSKAENASDLQGKMEALGSLQKIFEGAQRAPAKESAFCSLKQGLEQKAIEWAEQLRKEPAASELESVLQSLTAISREDRGTFGRSAADRITDVLEESANDAQLAHDWLRAADLWQRLSELDPSHLGAAGKEAACRDKWKNEQRLYAGVVDAQQAGRLNEAIRMAQHLQGVPSVKEKAWAKVAELRQEATNLERRSDAVWNAMASFLGIDAGDLHSRLYLLEERDLEIALKEMRSLASAFGDSKTIAERVKTLEYEVSARGELRRLGELEKEVSRAGERATPADFNRIVLKAKEALGTYPGYVPFQQAVLEWQERIRTALYDSYDCAVHERRFHSALRFREEWHKLLPGEAMQLDSFHSVGDLLALSELKELMEKARKHAHIADTFFDKLDYRTAREQAEEALRICADDPVALDISRKLEKWETGIALLKEMESVFDAYKKKDIADLAQAQGLLGKVQELGITFIDLKDKGFRHNSLDGYQGEIDRLAGITDSTVLSIVPARHQTFLVFLTDEIRFGNPRDTSADVQIRAGGIREGHARIVRRNGAFCLMPGAGECRIAGNLLTRHEQLREGEEIQLGATFRLVVDALSRESIVLIMPDSNPVSYELSGFILMGRTLDLGSERPASLRSHGLKEPSSILYDKGTFSIKRGANHTPLLLNERQQIGDVSITITRRKL